MIDADDTDREARRIEADQRRQEHADRRAELAQLRAKDHREWEQTLKWADELLANLREEIKGLRGRLKRRAVRLTVAGALAGVALIWGASKTHGFGSMVMNAEGTGLLFAATVSVAAYAVARYWKAATETSNQAILEELRDMHNRLTDAWVILDSADKGVLKDLDEFLMHQEAERLAAEEERQHRRQQTIEMINEFRAWRTEREGRARSGTSEGEQPDNGAGDQGHTG